MSAVFDPEALQTIVKKNLALPLEARIDAIIADIDEAYPRRITTRKRWNFTIAGSVMGQVNVLYRHNKTNSSLQMWYAFIVPNLPEVLTINWEHHIADPFDPETLSQQPFGEAYYGDVPRELQSKSSFNELENSMIDWVYKNLPIFTYHNTELDTYCRLDEDPDDFMARIGLATNFSMVGRMEEARAEGAEVMRINPTFSLDYFANTLPFKEKADIDRMIDALRQAGLE